MGIEEKGNAVLTIEGKNYELPIIEGSEGERAVDIRKLRGETGYIAYDESYADTGSCLSNITFIDGEGFEADCEIDVLYDCCVCAFLFDDLFDRICVVEVISGGECEFGVSFVDRDGFAGGV